MGTVMLVLKNIILDTVYSALKINRNSGCSVYSGLHLAKNNQKANKKVNSDDTEGEEERDCAQKVCKRDRSELETAPYKPAEIASGITPSQRRTGSIPKHRYFGEHLVTCLLEVNCLCWGTEVGIQDHHVPGHKDMRCE